MINIGDLVTLKGLKNTDEKPLGIVMKVWATDHAEIMWVNATIAARFALHKVIDPRKLDII